MTAPRVSASRLSFQRRHVTPHSGDGWNVRGKKKTVFLSD